MTRYKKKPGLRAQLKRKREETDDIDSNPAKRSAPGTNTATKSNQKHSPAPDAVVDPALLADHFAKCTRKWFPDSSPIELEEQYLPLKAFLDTTGFDKDRVATNLPEFLERFSSGGKDSLSACNERATPHTLVVTSSGMRTADLYRELQIFNNEESKVAKLIAKHMKLKKNIEYMQENKIGMAIATPFRFKQLIDAEALKTGGLRRIVVDASYRDEKRNTIFMMDQVFQPLVALLNEESIRQRYGNEEKKIEILVF